MTKQLFDDQHADGRFRVRGPVDRLLVLFGDQLDIHSPLLDELDRDKDAVLMMEVDEEARHVASHKQRTALFLAAMRHHALYLVERGYRVRYVTLDQDDSRQSFDDEIERSVRALEPSSLVCERPGEWRVLDMIEGWRESLRLDIDVREGSRFLTTDEQFGSWRESRASPLMEHFYRHQRKRLGLLMTDSGSPVGGKWNFDEENRQRFSDAPEIRRPYSARPDETTTRVLELVKRRFPDAPGRCQGFRWPVTRREALRALRDFIERRLPSFGRYQDAMWTDEPFLYHSLLSSSLNLGLLHPRECVDAAIAALDDGSAPLPAVEGFVRQIIGWREFIRGVYWYEGREYGTGNFFGHEGRLPEFYWTAETDMNCMRQSIGQVFSEGYGHHIHRLMITGNFALIAGIEPQPVNDWYLGMYVDAVDWVTLPNTHGMTLHADGGVVGTKPYAASGKYVKRMSNYCDSCRFDVSKRTGDDACPFNTFYWDFLVRHQKRLGRNRRMALILKHVDKMTDSEKREIRRSARSLRRAMDIE